MNQYLYIAIDKALTRVDDALFLLRDISERPALYGLREGDYKIAEMIASLLLSRERIAEKI